MEAKLITEGEFAGWSTWPNEPFEHDAAGPFYLKEDSDGKMLAAFRGAWEEVVAELSAEDEDFARVWSDFQDFRKQYAEWAGYGYLK